MKIEKFKIANLVKELAIIIDKNLINFPKKEVELKHKIKEANYNLLLIIYEANTTTDMNYRIKLQEKAIAMVKYLDFLINLCYDKQIIKCALLEQRQCEQQQLVQCE